MTLHYLHLLQATAILLVSTVLAWRHWKNVRDLAYLQYWLAACAVWFLYYLFKFGITIFPVESYLVKGFVFIDIELSNFNSILILFASMATRTDNRVPPGASLTIILVTFVGTLLAALYLAESLGSYEKSQFFLSWPSAAVSAFVLVLFYHRFALRLLNMDKSLTMAIWLFIGYAFLQREYPYLMGPGREEAREAFLYVLALVLKLACTFLIFLRSPEGVLTVGKFLPGKPSLATMTTNEVIETT